MPERLARDEAVRRVAHAAQGCLMCDVMAGVHGPPLWLARGEHASVLLPRFALRWGHMIVSLHRCIDRVAEVEALAWAEASELGRQAAVALEGALEPARTYVASLGTARGDIPMSTAHVHLHVVPLADPNARPSEVLTWRDGVFVADETEWAALQATLRAAWPE